MAKVVNQNDIVEIVRSQTEIMDEILPYLKSIIKICESVSNINSSQIQKNIGALKNIIPDIIQLLSTIVVPPSTSIFIQSIKNSMDSIFKLVTHISGFSIKLFQIINLYWKLFWIRRILKKIINTCNDLTAINDFKKILITIANLGLIKILVSDLASIINSIASIPGGLKLLWMAWFTVRRVKKVIQIINKVIKYLNELDFVNPLSILKSLIKIKLVKYIIGELVGVIESVINVKYGVKMWFFGWFYLWRLRKNIKLISKICTSLTQLNGYNLTGALKTTFLLRLIFHSLSITFYLLAHTKSGIFFRWKLSGIIKSLKLLVIILRLIQRLRVRMSVLRRLYMVSIVMINLTSLFLFISISAPLAALSLIAMTIIVFSMIGIVVLFKALTTLLKSFVNIKTILTLIIFSMIVGILTFILVLIAKAAAIVVENAGNIFIFLGLLIAVIFATGIIGVLLATVLLPYSILAIAGIGIMLVMIGMIFLMALMLQKIGEFKFDEDKIKKNIESVINTALMVINCIFGGKDKDSKESNKSWIVSVIEKFAGGLTYIIDAIMAISFLATTIVSILLITVIASQLRLLQELNLDPDKIRTNIQNIFDICNMIKNQLFSNIAESKSEEDSNIGSIIGKFFKPMADIANALSMFKFLSISLVAIGGFSKLAKHLQTINEFNGIQNIDQKINSIKSLCSTIIQGISEDPEGYTYNKAKNKISIISDLLEAVYDYGRMNSQDVENMTKITDGYIKFFDKINSVDLTQLKTTVTLFEKLAEFSESINGNFEGLAESLNEKIAPLLEELKKIMDGVGQKVEKSGANTSASIFAANQQSLSTNEMHQQVDRQLPNGTDEQKEKLVQQMMEKQAQQQTNSIISKLEDFIQVFKSGQYSEARL